MNGIRIKLKTIWKVLIADDFLVCTTRKSKDGLNFYHSYCKPTGSETNSGVIIEALLSRVKDINKAIGIYNKECDESKGESNR